jgi:hypothetical protein
MRGENSSNASPLLFMVSWVSIFFMLWNRVVLMLWHVSLLLGLRLS